jgi:ribulose-phosphate 3-epimerase
MSRPIVIAPSILSADFGRLAEQVQAIDAGGADWVHVDVMDGHFVPNLTIGPMIVRAVRKVTKLPLDVHLMITNADDFLDEYADAGADIITVHAEACTHLHRTIQRIHGLGKKPGVALNPATSLDAVRYVIDDLAMVLVMSVNPGFGGQSFIPHSLDKVRRLRAMLTAAGSTAQIEIDGGIDASNVTQVVDAGATILVAGNAIFGTPDAEAATRALRAAANGAAAAGTRV